MTAYGAGRITSSAIVSMIRDWWGLNKGRREGVRQVLSLQRGLGVGEQKRFLAMITGGGHNTF